MLISTKWKHAILKNQDRRLSLRITDHELEVVDTAKYLGLQIDRSLDWKYHVIVISSKVSNAEHVSFTYFSITNGGEGLTPILLSLQCTQNLFGAQFLMQRTQIDFQECKIDILLFLTKKGQMQSTIIYVLRNALMYCTAHIFNSSKRVHYFYHNS